MGTRLWIVMIVAVSLLFPAAVYAAGPDACSLLDATSAQKALGEPVGPPKLENRSFGKGEATSCQYRSTVGKSLKAKSVSLEVRHSDDDLTGSAKGIEQSFQSSGFKNVHQVSGVGSAAVWASNSIFGRSQGELTVIQGKSIMLIVLIEGVPNEAGAISNATLIASKALAKL
jgi:hypothetical protein